MTATLEGTGLSIETIADKVIDQQRLSAEEGLFLLETPDGEAVRKLADLRRKQVAGDTVYYTSTLFIHPTNLCELSCPMCSFYSKPGWDNAWFNTPEKIEKMVKEALPKGVREIHFVGGLWRDCDLDYYKDAFGRIKALDPTLHIKALTAVEYDFLSKLHGISIEEVFKRMMDYGLGSLPGGGAEILDEEVRKKLAPQKITTDEYLAIHGIAHGLGLNSNITMLYGHVEEHHHIIAHLCRVREQQDISGGFQTFVPLKYHEENNALGKRKHKLRPKDNHRVYAVSRLMLDNVRNLKVLWNYAGIKAGQEILNWGGNDFGSTAFDEKIIVMAGGRQGQMTVDMMEQVIKDCGRIPHHVDSGHNYSKDDQCSK